ncbi:MAG: DUF4173 domain-containing protein, partial [Psychroserpens sp.]|nr:DUF4173 domain-containing protein [Psychroserpens sp.]
INRNSASVEALNKELQLGVTLLGLLNLLILVYIITDVAFLVQFEALSNAQLSQQVHQGIYTLIVSIVIAIGIILIVFRGNLNFYKSNVNLKRLAYVWIFLNIVLIALTAIKNQNYIYTLGLTHKRIGVHIYLFLVLSGLITTYIKVKDIKNLAYLFRMNTQIATVILILCSLVNWDKQITAYNLNKAQQFDITYLIQLSDSNAEYLYLYRNAIPISETDRSRIVTKYDLYSSRVYSRTWQEWQLDNLTLNHQKSDLNY